MNLTLDLTHLKMTWKVELSIFLELDVNDNHKLVIKLFQVAFILRLISMEHLYRKSYHPCVCPLT